MSLGDRLREERIRLGLNQEALGKIGGVRKQAQLLYEKGERKPDSGYLTAIAEAGVDVLYILTGQRNPNLDDPRPTPPKYEAPPDEEWLLDIYRSSDPMMKSVILESSKAAALAARAAMPASVRRKTS